MSGVPLEIVLWVSTFTLWWVEAIARRHPTPAVLGTAFVVLSLYHFELTTVGMAVVVSIVTALTIAIQTKQWGGD